MNADSNPSEAELRKTLEDIQRRLSQLERAVAEIRDARPEPAKPEAPYVLKPLDQPEPAGSPVEREAPQPPPLPGVKARRFAESAAALAKETHETPTESAQSVGDVAVEAASKPADVRSEAPARSARSGAAPDAVPGGPTAGAGKLSLEQWLGMKAMLFVGVVVLLLSAVFFFKFAVDKGWINPSIRVLIGAAAGLAMIGLGEWSLLRRGLRLFAAGIMGGGVVLLYFVVFVASPNGWYNLINSPVAFALMCGVTALGMALSVQTRMLSTAVVALIGAMATPALLSTGENRQVLLMSYMLIVDVGFLAVSLTMRWAVLAPLALAGSAILFGGWYAEHFTREAWPRTLGFAWAMVSAFVAHIVIGVRTRRLPVTRAKVLLPTILAVLMVLLLFMHSSMTETAFLACVAAMAALALAVCGLANWPFAAMLSLYCPLIAMGCHAVRGADAPNGLLGVLAGINAAMLAVSLWRKWISAGILAVVQAVCVVGLWTQFQFVPADWATLNVFVWLLLGELVVYACAVRWWERADERVAWGLLVGAGSAAVVLWMALVGAAWLHAMLGNVMALTVVALAICTWRRMSALHLAALAWPAAALACQFFYRLSGGEVPEYDRWAMSAWAWGFFALLSAQTLAMAFWRARPMNERVHAAVSAGAMAGMFALTYWLLRTVAADWMGTYTAALGAGAIALAVAVRRVANRRRLAYSLLGQGLVLLVLAVPIEFERATITLAWAVQGVVVMFLARRLKSLSLLIMSPMVLLLALMHFFRFQLPGDETMREAAFMAFGEPITWGLLLIAAVTAAILGAAGILRAGKPLFSDDGERLGAIALVLVGAVCWAFRMEVELPVTGATWTWLLLGGGLAATALAVRSEWLGVVTVGLLAATVGKWVVVDTLGMRLSRGANVGMDPLANWQFLAGLVALVGLAVFTAVQRRRVGHPWQIGEVELPPKLLAAVAGLVCAAGIAYAVSFEIDRYFASDARRVDWQQWQQAMHTAYSVWWAVFAAVMMALGFIRRSRGPRILAMAVFALTLGKVFLVDMRNVEAVYRILSFLCLSTLLIAGSWLYQRYFRQLVNNRGPAPMESGQAPGAEDKREGDYTD